ncbi:MAG: isochorismate synthase MenF [Bacillus sp. (in: firmicutes)]
MALGIKTMLREEIQQAIQKANALQTKVLFSHVDKAWVDDPLEFYKAGKKLYQGERMYWQAQDCSTVLVGLGNEVSYSFSGMERYSQLETAWKIILADAVIHRETNIPATGPLLFGGFSFDHLKGQTSAWNRFGDSLFYLPRYLLTCQQDDVYMTTNVFCHPGDSIDRIIGMIERGQHLLRVPGDMQQDHNPVTDMREQEPERWKSTVADAIEMLKATSMDKIVLARELRLSFKNRIQSEEVLRRLREAQKTSFLFCLESGNDCFIGASPERLVKKDRDEVLSTCLAGSIARGKTDSEDQSLGTMLMTDPKNRMEHQYVVGMIKESLESVCSEVHVPDHPVLMKTKHIQHLYTPVNAKSGNGVSIMALVEKLHPTPALGGLPREESLRWIRENENMDRGFYAGPIGWTDSYENGEFAVAIRSALIQENEASLYAGCGIVEESSTEEEYNETWIKFKPMLHALGGEPE